MSSSLNFITQAALASKYSVPSFLAPRLLPTNPTVQRLRSFSGRSSAKSTPEDASDLQSSQSRGPSDGESLSPKSAASSFRSQLTRQSDREGQVARRGAASHGLTERKPSGDQEDQKSLYLQSLKRSLRTQHQEVHGSAGDRNADLPDTQSVPSRKTYRFRSIQRQSATLRRKVKIGVAVADGTADPPVTQPVRIRRLKSRKYKLNIPTTKRLEQPDDTVIASGQSKLSVKDASKSPPRNIHTPAEQQILERAIQDKNIRPSEWAGRFQTRFRSLNTTNSIKNHPARKSAVKKNIAPRLLTSSRRSTTVWVFESRTPVSYRNTARARYLARKALRTYTSSTKSDAPLAWTRLRKSGDHNELYDSTWTERFWPLNAVYDPWAEGGLHVPTKVGREWLELAEKLANTPSAQQITDIWRQQEKGLVEWKEMMLAIMHKHPFHTSRILSATIDVATTPGYIASDCLAFVINYFCSNKVTIARRTRRKVFGVIQNVLRKGGNGYSQLDEPSVALFTRHIKRDLVYSFFRELEIAGQPLSPLRLEKFAAEIACSRRTGAALKIILRLARDDNGWDINSPRALQICSFILHQKHRGTGSDALTDSEIFASLLGAGLRPDARIYNVLLHNALQTGSSSMGWEIHDQMVAHGVEPTAATYSILLTHAKNTQNRSDLNTIVNIIRSKKMYSHNLASGMLSAICEILKPTESPRNAAITSRPRLLQMFAVFQEHYDIHPLQEIVPLYAKLPRSLPRPNRAALGAPSLSAITAMITATVEELSSQDVVNLYKHFRALLQDGHEDAMLLVKTTQVYDTFIRALGRDLSTIHICPEIITHMIQRHEACRKPPPSKGKKTPLGRFLSREQKRQAFAFPTMATWHEAAPDVHTFSILLHCYMQLKQTRAGEAVLQLMKKRGVEPNRYTWTTLLTGYAKMNDTTGLANTINRMQAEGVLLDQENLHFLSSYPEYHKLAVLIKAPAMEPRTSRANVFESPDAVHPERRTLVE